MGGRYSSQRGARGYVERQNPARLGVGYRGLMSCSMFRDVPRLLELITRDVDKTFYVVSS